MSGCASCNKWRQKHDHMFAEARRQKLAYEQELSETRAELESQVSEWIPVKPGSMPEYDVPVLVVSAIYPDQIDSAMLVDEGDGWMWATKAWYSAISEPRGYEVDDDYEYSHWMPLPKPPEGK